MKLANRIKIVIIATLVILVAGMTLFGVLGFNNTTDFKAGYEVKVELYEVLENADEQVVSSVESYLTEKGIAYNSSLTRKLDDGRIVIFNTDAVTQANADEIKAKVVADLNAKGGTFATLVVEDCTVYSVEMFDQNQIGWVALAVGIALVALFIYVGITEKLAGALSVIFSSLISGFAFISLIALTRIPAGSVWALGTALSAILGGVVSMGIVNRCSEDIKNTGNDKLTYPEIASGAFKASLLRLSFTLGALVLAGIAFIALPIFHLTFIGLQLIVSAVCGFGSAVWTEFIWALISNRKKDRKVKSNEN